MDKNVYAFETFGDKLNLFEDSGKVLEATTPIPDALALSLVATIESLKNLPIDTYGGYGWFDAHGSARYGTWQAWVTKPQIMVKKPDTQDFYTWKEIFAKDFVDPKLIHQILVQLNQLLKYVPPERTVIFGAFGPGNILIDGNKVIGLKDWNEAGYGDYLYDVAYFDFWHEGYDFVNFSKGYYTKSGNDVSNFFQRIDCHRLFIGLTALGVYASLDLKDAYYNMVDRMKRKNLIF